MTVSDLDLYRQKILNVRPDFSVADFKLLTEGWDCIAISVNDRFIFRFPRRTEISLYLKHEADLLDAIRPYVAMPIPNLRLYRDGDDVFTLHEKIIGDHLLEEDYNALSDDKRQHVADKLAAFYAALHGINIGTLPKHVAAPIWGWYDAAELREKALPLLSAFSRKIAEKILDAFGALPPDPYGDVFGYFDAHGWNMAFDTKQGVLNGIYDFAGSGVGALHREFVLPSLISYDLVERTVMRYETLTRRCIDRRRLTVMTGNHRLGDIAARPDDPAMIVFFEKWVASPGAQKFLNE